MTKVKRDYEGLPNTTDFISAAYGPPDSFGKKTIVFSIVPIAPMKTFIVDYKEKQCTGGESMEIFVGIIIHYLL